MSENPSESVTRGRLDEVGLAELDVVEFNDGVNPWAPVRTVESGFKPRLSRFRHYQNLGRAERRLEQLLDEFRFSSVRNAMPSLLRRIARSEHSRAS